VLYYWHWAKACGNCEAAVAGKGDKLFRQHKLYIFLQSAQLAVYWPRRSSRRENIFFFIFSFFCIACICLYLNFNRMHERRLLVYICTKKLYLTYSNFATMKNIRTQCNLRNPQFNISRRHNFSINSSKIWTTFSSSKTWTVDGFLERKIADNILFSSASSHAQTLPITERLRLSIYRTSSVRKL